MAHRVLQAEPSATESPCPRPTPPLVVQPPAKVPVAGPSITASELAAVAAAAQHGWYGGAGSFVARFERAFAELHGVRFALALPSCTAAIHLALAAHGIGPGDEVIVPDLTWIATAAPLDYLGATPVFADVDPHTWCLCPASVERCLTERARAIVAVDLYGNLPDFAALRRLAAARGIPLLEDAAEAIGSRRGARLAGSFGDVGLFSFHGSKTLTTGEGGMLITDDERVYERCRVLQDHGRRPGDRSFACDEVAFKYKMTDLQAALGLAQLERLDELVAGKRRIFASYRHALADVPGLAWNEPGDDVFASYWMTTVVLAERPPADRDGLQRALAAAGIDSRPFFPPLSSTPAYRDRPEAAAAAARNRHSQAIGPRGLNLPSALSLDEATIARVAAVVRNHLQEP
jgi:perosamine synthetase